MTILKRYSPTLDIFSSTKMRFKRHKKHILPLKQRQSNQTTTFTTNYKSPTPTFITTTLKPPPKLKIPLPTILKLTLEHSISVIDMELFPKKNTTPTTTTATTQIKIPDLKNTNTSLPTRFRMHTTYSSSITIPL